MIFRNRVEAGRLLAGEVVTRLPGLRDEKPIVLGIPRGGVLVAREVATALRAPLDVFVARKLGAPDQEELGIGAVAFGGTRVLDEHAIRSLGVSQEYIDAVTQRELAELQRRMARFRGDREDPHLENRAVILVDDGLATGVTAHAALIALRAKNPALLVFAAPVCSREGSMLLSADADEVICVSLPDRFYGVGTWYEDFDQTSDEEVISALAESSWPAS